MGAADGVRWYRVPVTVYDWLYRRLHGLDSRASLVGPALRVEVRRNHRRLVLRDGTVIRRGDRIGLLHLNNERVTALHCDGRPPASVGLEFRRLLVQSLVALADRAGDDDPLADVRAFAAITIFARGLARLGFEPEPRPLPGRRLVALYQRALLTTLHPEGTARLRGPAFSQARRLWLSREALLARYADGREPDGAVGRRLRGDEQPG